MELLLLAYLNLSCKRCSQIRSLADSKRGKFYLKFIIAVALIASAIYSYSALAAVPSAIPSIVNTNTTTINGVPIANASIARATDNLFTNVNFSNENGTFEENSTFKLFKRTYFGGVAL